jgi:BirA family transcriptional regulator, biotin operon repressor / biotin---[acetyl-CoA-carboxylase] ligase
MGERMESTRKKLITLLAKQAVNEYISGQKLSEELQISRSAIWKHMKALEKDGYEIEAVTNKGYRIINFPNQMSVNTIQWGLQTKWLGAHLYYEKRLDSTQTFAHQLARDGAVHGTVVIADEQLKGRGRLSRNWDSQKGKGIWMSIILRPPLEPHRAPQLTLLTAVAIANMLKVRINVEAKIKWPNDIFLNDHKLCGVLTEIQAEQDLIQYVIIGIGLNVNHEQDDIPDDLKGIATSLKIETNKNWQREKLIWNLLDEFEKKYELYIQKGFPPIKQQWESYAYMKEQIVSIKAGNQVFDGKIIGIHDDGALLVEDQEQNIRQLYSAEIDWKREGIRHAHKS